MGSAGFRVSVSVFSVLFWCCATLADTPSDKIKCADQGFRPGMTAKAINGSPAGSPDWPWFAALEINDEGSGTTLAMCGGTVIAPFWVLTAAHCLEFIDKTSHRSDIGELGIDGRLQAVIGVDDLRQASPSNIYDVEAFYMHDAFEAAYEKWLDDRVAARSVRAREPRDPSQTMGNDIALIKLSRPWNGPLAPLPKFQEDDFGGGDVSVAGFGTVSVIEKGANQFIADVRKYTLPGGRTLEAGCAHLMQVKMPLVSTNQCLARYSGAYFVPKIGGEQICSGFEDFNQDSCSGDSGGPLVAVTGNGEREQAGIVSWGAANCAGEKRSYGVYTRVAKYIDWIEGKVGPLPGVAASPALADRRSFFREALGDLKIDLPGKGGGVKIAVDGGPRVRLGQQYKLHATSSVPGKLIILDIDASNKVLQIFPNGLMATMDLAVVKAGQEVVVPNADWGFSGFQAGEPIGKGMLIALVVPPDFPDTTYGQEVIEQKTKGFVHVQFATSYLMNLLEQVSQRASRSPGQSWAYETYDYEIVR
jgi:secreted trypsin-like serine protease